MLMYSILIFVSGSFPFFYYLAKAIAECKWLFAESVYAVAIVEAILGLLIGIFVLVKSAKSDARSNPQKDWEKVKQLMSVNTFAN